MAVYNTASDSANTAVRAFLTKVGEYYLGHSFNTASGKGKVIWEAIRDTYFKSCCAYCGLKTERLQVEHVLMFNRTEFGLHHPGNTVPCCKLCNKRARKSDKSFCSWEEHLFSVCSYRKEEQLYETRKEAIKGNFKRFSYPKLNENEKHAIRVIAASLYENIKTESEKSLSMYKQLDEAFVKSS
ncbi:HNH endonuclease [Photobacterium sanguinicancri]|uniref:HNH endonuclease n=1 Tax=Photobacterium sanguinicancri TaxID=875932 RepID=A0ABX4G3T8_9GAMM|nr:HNH endonuclease [Photobacterium sanguinicancri]OZS45851.1 HNH endonuclease [Photobacterium sanguinicancri]